MELLFGLLLALFFLRDEPPPAPAPRAVADELVVLIPQYEDGHVGTLAVDRAGKQQVLNKAYAASRIHGDGAPKAEQLDKPTVEREFGGLLSGLPSLTDERVVVVPPETGGPAGAVLVEHGETSALLDGPYASSRITSLGAPEVGQSNRDEVKREFGSVLSAVPSLTDETVVVLPADFDGHVGTVVVERAGVERVLHKAYLGTHIDSLGPPDLVQHSKADIDAQFGSTLGAMPPPPAKYLLYFVLGRDELTAQSKIQLKKVLGELAKRAVPDVLVVGHTDTVAGAEVNDRLSLQRAEVVKQLLVNAGVPAGRIETAGRGSRELLIPTGNGVDEPRNRRVEIFVR